MFFPNHNCRTYCTYLGSIDTGKEKVDLGVYEYPDGMTSHAIVYGEDDSEYISGHFKSEDHEKEQSLFLKINMLAWHLYKKTRQVTVSP